MNDHGLIFYRHDQADEVNKRFITWLVLNKQNIPIKMLHSYSVTKLKS